MSRVAGIAARMVSWRSGSLHQRILSAGGVVAIFALAAKLAGAAKEIVVARQFGLSDDVDAFALALTLPSFAIALLGGALNSSLIPAYLEVREREGRDAARRFLSTVLVLAVGLLVTVTIALAVLAPTILPLASSRFTPEKMRLTVQLSYMLVPSVAVAGCTMTFAAVLNAHERFAPAASAALAIPLVSILALLLFGDVLGIRALAVGIFLGYCTEAFLVFRAVRREGIPALPRWGGLTPAVRRMAGQFAPMLAGGLVMGTNPVIDSMMASRLDPGSVASLSYGNKLVSFGMGIGALSLSAAIFPYFSRMASSRDWSGLGKTIRIYGAALLAITVPVTLAAMFLSEPIARLLFERGAFTAADTVQVGRVQALYLAQVPFHLTSLLFVRFLSATAGNRILMWLALVNCVVNVVGNVVLSRILGAAGIALSTSIVYAVAFTLLGLVTWRRLRALRSNDQALHLRGTAIERAI